MKFTKSFESFEGQIPVGENKPEDKLSVSTSNYEGVSTEGLPSKITHEISELTEEGLSKIAMNNPSDIDIPKDLSKKIKEVDLNKTFYDIPVGVNDQEGVPLVGNAEAENSNTFDDEDNVFYSELDEEAPPVERNINYDGKTGTILTKEGSWSTGSHKFAESGLEKEQKEENNSQIKKEGDTTETASDDTNKKTKESDNLESTSGKEIEGGVYRPLNRNHTKTPDQEDGGLPSSRSLKRDKGDRPKYYDEIPDDVKPRQQPPALPKTNPETQPPPLPKKSRGELLDSIDKENELTRMVNSEEFGAAKGFISTHFSKLKSKFGWVKDGLISLFFVKPRETKLDIVLGWNDSLLNKKQKDLDKAIGKAEKAKRSSEQDKLDRENKLEQINESLERARRDGNTDMVNLLTRAKEGLEKQNSRELAGEAAENIKEQMLFYRKRKERILDDFIGDIDSRTEKIREDTEYYKNLERRSLIDDGIGRLQGVITKGETEMLNLKTAMSAPGLSRADRKIIKTKINEISDAIGESRDRLSYYNSVRGRLEDLIEITDNRTNRFDEYKKPYVEAANRLKPNKSPRKTTPPPVGKKITPPPLPGSSERADWEKNKNKSKDSTVDSSTDSTTKAAEAGGTIADMFKGLDEKSINVFVDDIKEGLSRIGSFKDSDIGDQQKTNSLFNNIKTMHDKISGFLDRAVLAGEKIEGSSLVKFKNDLLKIIKNFGGKKKDPNKTIDSDLLKQIGLFYKEMNEKLNPKTK